MSRLKYSLMVSILYKQSYLHFLKNQRFSKSNCRHNAVNTRCIWSKKSTMHLSHICSHRKLPGILAKEKENTDAIIMTVSIALLEQASMLHKQFHLSPQHLHKLLPALPVSWCKHLSRSCATCTLLTPLGPLSRGWGWTPMTCCLMPLNIWK